MILTVEIIRILGRIFILKSLNNSLEEPWLLTPDRTATAFGNTLESMELL